MNSAQLWRATGLIALANGTALGLQFFTTILIARAFGTSAQMDAYALAVSISESFQYLLLLATLSVLFTPLWIDLRARRGDAEAWSMALSLLLCVTAGVILLLPILLWLMPQLISLLAPGFPPATRALAVELSDLILPGLIYYATAGILLGICYAHHDFRIAALNTFLLAALNLAAFFIFVQWLGGGVRGLMVGRLCALAGVEIFLLWGALRHARGVKWRVHLFHPEFRVVLKFMPPYIFGAFSGQLALIINRAFVSTLGTGSVAAWGYGQRLADIPLAILGAAFGATFLPDFSAQIATNERDAASTSWNRAVVRTSLTLAPIAALLIPLAVPLITVLFQRGSFDANSTQASALVLMGLAVGLPLRGVAGLVVRGMPAFKTRALPIVLSAVSTLTNLVLDFAFIGAFGLFGIALAASIGDAMFAAVGTIVFWRWLKTLTDSTRITLAKICGAALLAGGGAFFAQRLLETYSPLAQLLLGAAFGAAIFLLLAIALDLGETRAFLQFVQQRVMSPRLRMKKSS